MTVYSKKFLTVWGVLFSIPPSEGWTTTTKQQHHHPQSHSVLASFHHTPSGKKESSVRKSKSSLYSFPSMGDLNNNSNNDPQRNPAIIERGSGGRRPMGGPGIPQPLVRSSSSPMRRSNVPQTSAIQRPNVDRRSQALTRPRRDSAPVDDAAALDLKPSIIQGNSLRTWSFTTSQIQSVQVSLFTEGRPLNAVVDVWTGPDSTPQRMAVFLEDGSVRPFNAVVFVPRSVGGQHHAVAVRNTGAVEFPIQAAVEVGSIFAAQSFEMDEVAQRLFATQQGKTIQGGAVKTIPFSPSVASIQLLLTSDGRPLNARIEMLQGPSNVKQIMEIQTEDGNARPFFAIIETPGYGNVVRIVNTGPMEFPIECRIGPYTVEDDFGDGGGGGFGPPPIGNWEGRRDSNNDSFFLR